MNQELFKKHSDKVLLTFDKLESIELPTSGEDYMEMLNCVEKLVRCELTQEEYDKFKKIPNAGVCWEKIKGVLRAAEYNARKKESL